MTRSAERRTEQETVELASTSSGDPDRRPAKPGFWREFAGVLTGGLIVLTLFVLVVEILAWIRGERGLGLVSLFGHMFAATLALSAQRLADRRVGFSAMIPGVGVAVIVVVTLWFFWWL
jgi:hypothetical protein